MINPETLSHRPHRLARPVGEQATHIQLTLDPLVRPCNRTIQHPRRELDQTRPQLRKLVNPHTNILTMTAALSHTTPCEKPNKALLIAYLIYARVLGGGRGHRRTGRRHASDPVGCRGVELLGEGADSRFDLVGGVG
jgi:hypothetical protein